MCKPPTRAKYELHEQLACGTVANSLSLSPPPSTNPSPRRPLRLTPPASSSTPVRFTDSQSDAISRDEYVLMLLGRLACRLCSKRLDSFGHVSRYGILSVCLRKDRNCLRGNIWGTFLVFGVDIVACSINYGLAQELTSCN